MRLEGLPYRATGQYGRQLIGGQPYPTTEFAAQVAWDGGALRVASVEWKGHLDTFYGSRDIRIGHPESDRLYFIQANPEALARRYLDEGTLDRLWHLHDGEHGSILLQVRPNHVLVRVNRRIERGPRLVAFAQDGAALVSRLLDVGEPGVRLQATSPAEEPECQVCGAKMAPADQVFCRRCRTPHHRDCWEYNQGCSTFGCGERRLG
jgi:hypothetical protein